MTPPLCSCGKPQVASGLCKSHYAKAWRAKHPKSWAKYNARHYAKRKASVNANEYIAPRIVYADRPCMECRSIFTPIGKANRRCARCNAHFALVSHRKYGVAI